MDETKKGELVDGPDVILLLCVRFASLLLNFNRSIPSSLWILIASPPRSVRPRFVQLIASSAATLGLDASSLERVEIAHLAARTQRNQYLHWRER